LGARRNRRLVGLHAMHSKVDDVVVKVGGGNVCMVGGFESLGEVNSEQGSSARGEVEIPMEGMKHKKCILSLGLWVLWI